MCIDGDKSRGTTVLSKGVGTARATEALAPAMLKPRGRKYVLAPAIIYQIYQLDDSQTSISLFQSPATKAGVNDSQV